MIRLTRNTSPGRARIVRACILGMSGGDVRRFSITVEALQSRGEYGSVRAIAKRNGVNPSTLWRWLGNVDRVVPVAVKADERSVAENGTDGVME